MITIPGIGALNPVHGWKTLERCSDGVFTAGSNGVKNIVSTGDGKVELITFADRTLAYVNSELSPAYYPLRSVALKRPVKAVLMDLDGTTVRSETFWIWIIERTVATLLNDGSFRLCAEDMPFVSGHSVSEHLLYCLKKYAPAFSLSEARKRYTKITKVEMDAILRGEGRVDAFTPTPGIKKFLLALKERGIKVALVTSGLYQKAYPEILSAFRTLGLGDPAGFYDCIITAGEAPGKGRAGTLGELEAKPHPWLYAEACRVGLGIAENDSVIGIEDSGAGVCSVRLAGYYTAGLAGGNIKESGTLGMCHSYFHDFGEILRLIDGEC